MIQKITYGNIIFWFWNIGFIWEKDVAQKLYKLFIAKKEGDFNICSGKAISVRKLVEKRIKERNSNIQLKLGYYPYSDYESMAFWGINDNL